MALLHGIGFRTPVTSDRAGRASVGLTLAVLAAPLLFGAAALSVLIASLAGFNPLWRESELNLAEAAALRDRGAIQRLLWDGADPNLAHYVRPRILTQRGITVTPLQAAIGTRELYMVEFLLQRGARIDAGNREGLICLAVEQQAGAILDFLNTRSNGGTPDCSRVEIPW